MGAQKVNCDTDVMIDYWDRSQTRHLETVRILETAIGLFLMLFLSFDCRSQTLDQNGAYRTFQDLVEGKLMDTRYTLKTDTLANQPCLRKVSLGLAMDHLHEDWKKLPKFIVDSNDLYINLKSNNAHLSNENFYFNTAWVKFTDPHIYSTFYVFDPDFRLKNYLFFTEDDPDERAAKIESNKIYYVFSLLTGEVNKLSPVHMYRLLDLTPALLNAYAADSNKEKGSAMVEYVNQLNRVLEGPEP